MVRDPGVRRPAWLPWDALKKIKKLNSLRVNLTAVESATSAAAAAVSPY